MLPHLHFALCELDAFLLGAFVQYFRFTMRGNWIHPPQRLAALERRNAELEREHGIGVIPLDWTYSDEEYITRNA